MLAVVVLAGTACSSDSDPEIRPLSMLGHTGRWITDPEGRVVILHGVNMVNKRPPYLPAALGFDGDDADYLVEHGFRAVRVGVIWKAVEPEPGVYDDRYLEQIDQTVEMLADHGIYSLLDFHQDALHERFGGEGFPDWAVRDAGGPEQPGPGTEEALYRALDKFWTNGSGPGGVGLQDRFAGAYAHVAQYFADHDSVLGYDLYNEPLTGGRWPECRTDSECTGFDADVGAFYRRVITAIREVDQRHLVWYEPNTLFNWAVPTHLPPLGDPRAGMAFHVYCPPPDPDGFTCDQSVEVVLDNADLRAAETGDALLVGEFGNPEGEVLTQFANRFDDRMLSWLMWSYCGCGNPTYPYPVDAHVDDLVIDATKPPGGSNVEQGKLEALVRPHPTVISGTPEAFGFDPASKEFSFTYTTARADGDGQYRAGACTEVFVPRLQYPDGYDVTVDGAEVVSDPESAVVALEADEGVERVTVEITPATDGQTELPQRGSDCSD